MIRRGLQVVFLCGITFLGAAPLHAQRAGYPQSITLTGISVAGYNGTYYWIGGTSSTSSYIWAKYDQTNGSRWASILELNSTAIFVQLHSSEPPTNNYVDTRVAWVQVATPVNGWPTAPFGAFNNEYNGGGTLNFAPPDPYEEAFPDWESAAVKIPLGFSFAMAFWGVAVAASVSMKWVRDLASAAS